MSQVKSSVHFRLPQHCVNSDMVGLHCHRAARLSTAKSASSHSSPVRSIHAQPLVPGIASDGELPAATTNRRSSTVSHVLCMNAGSNGQHASSKEPAREHRLAAWGSWLTYQGRSASSCCSPPMSNGRSAASAAATSSASPPPSSSASSSLNAASVDSPRQEGICECSVHLIA